MKLIEIMLYLVIFSFVITALSALSIISGPTYVVPGSEYDVTQYEEIGATELIWSHISANFLASIGAGIIAGIIAAKLMSIPGNITISIGIFTGLISYGLIGTAGLFWNIYRSLNPTLQPAMGIGLYMFFSMIGILLALSVIHILTSGGVEASG